MTRQQEILLDHGETSTLHQPQQEKGQVDVFILATAVVRDYDQFIDRVWNVVIDVVDETADNLTRSPFCSSLIPDVQVGCVLLEVVYAEIVRPHLSLVVLDAGGEAGCGKGLLEVHGHRS